MVSINDGKNSVTVLNDINEFKGGITPTHLHRTPKDPKSKY